MDIIISGTLKFTQRETELNITIDINAITASVFTKYPPKETPSSSYLQRTEWNVRDSDATVLFSIESALTGGSKKTVEFARKPKKPNLHLCAGDRVAAEKLKAFTEEHRVKILNVAGPQASNEPGVGDFVMRTLEEVFGALA